MQLVSTARDRCHTRTVSVADVGVPRPNKRNRVDQGSASDVSKISRDVITSPALRHNGDVLIARAIAGAGNHLADEMVGGEGGEGEIVDFSAFGTRDDPELEPSTSELSQL